MRGIVVLGLDAPAKELEESFAVAASFDLVKGFAVGRTIFAEVARRWLSGAIDDKTGELVNPIVSPVVVFENIDGEHGMAIGAALQRLLGDGVSGAAKGSGKHCMVASGANCGDTYRVMYSHDTPDGVESDGACETYFKPLLDSAKARACELWPGDDAVARALYADERDYDVEATKAELQEIIDGSKVVMFSFTT